MEAFLAKFNYLVAVETLAHQQPSQLLRQPPCSHSDGNHSNNHNNNIQNGYGVHGRHVGKRLSPLGAVSACSDDFPDIHSDADMVSGSNGVIAELHNYHCYTLVGPHEPSEGLGLRIPIGS